MRATSSAGGTDPSPYVAGEIWVTMSPVGVSPPRLDELGEPGDQEAERIMGERLCLATFDRRERSELSAELGVLLLWHAEQVGDDQQGERLAEVAHDLELAGVDELVDVLIGQLPDGRLVLAHPPAV